MPSLKLDGCSCYHRRINSLYPRQISISIWRYSGIPELSVLMHRFPCGSYLRCFVLSLSTVIGTCAVISTEMLTVQLPGKLLIIEYTGPPYLYLRSSALIITNQLTISVLDGLTPPFCAFPAFNPSVALRDSVFSAASFLRVSTCWANSLL